MLVALSVLLNVAFFFTFVYFSYFPPVSNDCNGKSVTSLTCQCSYFPNYRFDSLNSGPTCPSSPALPATLPPEIFGESAFVDTINAIEQQIAATKKKLNISSISAAIVYNQQVVWYGILCVFSFHALSFLPPHNLSIKGARALAMQTLSKRYQLMKTPSIELPLSPKVSFLPPQKQNKVIDACVTVFTNVMLMKLRDEGKVNLDDPVIKYEPRFVLKNPYNTARPITFRYT